MIKIVVDLEAPVQNNKTSTEVGGTIEDNMIRLYTVEDIQNIFKIGRTKAYELMSSDGFPSFRVNRKIYVSKSDLDIWVSKMRGKIYSY